MTKFNTTESKVKQALNKPHVTKNLEGAVAFKMEDDLRLYTRVLTSLVNEDKFYKKGDAHDKAILVNLKKVNPVFAAGLAVYAREVFNLRSIPVMLLAELAELHRGDKLVGRAIERIIQRPDELTEMVAYRLNKYSRTLPQQIKKGLARAFTKFDEYQLQKYNKAGDVKLKDVLFMVHPKPKDKEQDKMWKRLINDELKTPETWETKISGKGSTKENWEDMLKSGKMGIMAVIRNLRNFVEKEVDLEPAIKLLTDKNVILKSRQFPFRFYNAYRELVKVNAPVEILNAVVDAMEISTENVPNLDGRTLIAVDRSGSMDQPLSRYGSTKYFEIAGLLASIYHKKNPSGTIVGSFSGDWDVRTLNSRDSIITNMEAINKGYHGSTNTYKVFDWLKDSGEKFDRIIILSDEQAWDSGHGYGFFGMSTRENTVQESYIKSGHKGWLYSIDLAGYGTSSMDAKNPNVIKLAGWSEKVFNYLQKNEEDKEKVLNEIKKIGQSLLNKGRDK